MATANTEIDAWKYSTEQVTITEHDGDYGPYVQVETPRFTHSFALVDGRVLAQSYVDGSVLAALRGQDYEVVV